MYFIYKFICFKTLVYFFSLAKQFVIKFLKFNFRIFISTIILQSYQCIYIIYCKNYLEKLYTSLLVSLQDFLSFSFGKQQIIFNFLYVSINNKILHINNYYFDFWYSVVLDSQRFLVVLQFYFLQFLHPEEDYEWLEFILNDVFFLDVFFFIGADFINFYMFLYLIL